MDRFKVLLSVLVVGACLITTTESLCSKTMCNRYFKDCLLPLRNSQNITFGQRLPIGYTLSSFSEMVDIIERKLVGYNGSPLRPSQMAHLLLSWFACHDGMVENSEFFRYQFNAEAEQAKRKLIEETFAVANQNLSQYNFERDLKQQNMLTDDSMCFLTNALSHDLKWNITDEHSNSIKTTCITACTCQFGQALQIREEGVLSITGAAGEAVAIAPVLLGIAASDPVFNKMFSIGDLGPSYRAIGDVKVDPVTFVTLGAELGYSELKIDFSIKENRFKDEVCNAGKGVKGQWSNQGCLNKYILNAVSNNRGTLAQLSGAVDGFILGKALSKMNDLQKMSLTELLRFYYSDTKAFFSEFNSIVSVCNRNTVLQSYNTLLTEQTQLFINAMRKDSAVPYPDNIDNRNPEERASTAVGSLQQLISDNDATFRETICNTESSSSISDGSCATPMHLFLILDTNRDVINNLQLSNLQRDIVGGVMNHFRWAPHKTVVSLFSSGREGQMLQSLLTRNYQGVNSERNVAYKNISGSGCPGCYAQFLDRAVMNTGANSDDVQILQAINETLMRYKVEMPPLAGTPSRVVLWLRLRSGGVDENQASTPLANLKYKHPEVTFIAVGQRTLLEKINSKTNTFSIFDMNRFSGGQGISQTEDFKRLTRMMCRSSAQLQNERCHPWKTSDNTPTKQVTGILPNQVQFWSYDSNYFSASKDLQIEFEASHYGELRVCDATKTSLDASKPLRSTDFYNCLQTNGDEYRKLTFNYSYPCGRGPSSCPSMRFAVFGQLKQQTSSRQANQGDCTDVMCPNRYAIEFTVEPRGMVCAGVLSAVMSYQGLIACLICAIIFNRSL